MNKNIELIERALMLIADGEPLPSFLSEDFGALLSAARECVEPRQDGFVHRDDLAAIGNLAIGLLMARLKASVEAERTVDEMKSSGRKLN